MASEKGRVLCAMSGGVDSSVAAKLLVDAGYEVLGVTMRLFDRGRCGEAIPCKHDDVADAQGVCGRLGVRHQVVDFAEAFEENVVEPFCRSYLAGDTPNPCVDCNRTIKFGALERLRCDLGYDYVATGHYVRRAVDGATGRCALLRGLDPKKDQSYVLYHLPQGLLSHLLFPVGELSKDEVRAVARETGLSVADKEESQDICFIPDGDYAAFIERRVGPLAPGPIVDEAGAVLGEHRGLARYTVGQRKGLGVAVGEPLFVLAKDVEHNALVVGPASSTGVRTVVADGVNVMAGARWSGKRRVEAKTNYRSALRTASAAFEGDRLVVTLDEPVRAVAPGQAIVLYHGDEVVGGGTIRQGAR